MKPNSRLSSTLSFFAIILSLSISMQVSAETEETNNAETEARRSEHGEQEALAQKGQESQDEEQPLRGLQGRRGVRGGLRGVLRGGLLRVVLRGGLLGDGAGVLRLLYVYVCE